VKGFDYTDVVKCDGDFFLKSTTYHFSEAYLIPIGNHQLQGQPAIANKQLKALKLRSRANFP
jgi:hypothetical protein